MATIMREHPTFFERYGYLIAVGCILAATMLFVAGRGLLDKNQWPLLYLLVIGLVAIFCGVRAALTAALLSFFAWNYFFIPPVQTLRVTDTKEWLALAVFLMVGVTIGTLAGRMRERETRMLARERETAVLNRLSAHLVSLVSTLSMTRVVLEEVAMITGAGHVAIFLPDPTGEPQCIDTYPEGETTDPQTLMLARWAYRCRTAIGLPSSHHLGSEAAGWPVSKSYADVAGGETRHDLYLPLHGATQLEGTLFISARAQGSPYTQSDARLLLSIGNLAAAFLERQRLELAATRIDVLREADRLKSTLISSVSHELKTPLAAVTATVTSLLENDVTWDVPMMRTELHAVCDDLVRLHDSISALLDFARLEADAWEPQRDWYELGEVLGTAIEKMPEATRARIVFAIPDELPMLHVDFQQLARAFQHLIENAVAYSPPQSPIQIGAIHAGREVQMWVQDHGPGVPQQERTCIFEKFYRGSTADASPAGTGLGLAITAEIVRFHGGRIWVEEVRPQGARFMIALPSPPPETGSCP